VNIPLTGVAPVSVSGLNFGLGEHTPTAGLEMGGAGKNNACSTSSWTSSTSLNCVPVPLLDVFGYLQVTVGSVAGTGRGVFSFDAAVVSEIRRNAPQTGGSSVTVTGLGFGVGEHTATAGLERGGAGDLGVCLTSSWTSATTLGCRSNAFADLFQATSVTVASKSGTGQPVFSFDAAAASHMHVNAPHTGFASLTVSGLGFGVGEQTASTGL